MCATRKQYALNVCWCLRFTARARTPSGWWNPPEALVKAVPPSSQPSTLNRRFLILQTPRTKPHATSLGSRLLLAPVFLVKVGNMLVDQDWVSCSLQEAEVGVSPIRTAGQEWSTPTRGLPMVPRSVVARPRGTGAWWATSLMSPASAP